MEGQEMEQRVPGESGEETTRPSYRFAQDFLNEEGRVDLEKATAAISTLNAIYNQTEELDAVTLLKGLAMTIDDMYYALIDILVQMSQDIDLGRQAIQYYDWISEAGLYDAWQQRLGEQ